ncbi:MAG: 16S rRNA (adenine(1518)-N(6)/adenine(1519)-N(6))-dimethyltransferase RsmA [Bacillota bacterium]
MPAPVKALLAQCGITPNRALGQNFLADDAAVDAIVDAAKIDGQPVLEVGPGLGALTDKISERAGKVTAVELDERMVRYLESELVPRHKNLRIVQGDFLRVDLDAILNELGRPFCAVGNLPYYITTPIAERLILYGAQALTLMVQREAAERFLARPNDRVYGPLSILAQVYYNPQIVFQLSPHSFYPAPEVFSTVLNLSERSCALDRRALSRLLEASFRMRRKTLKNNLLPLGIEPSLLEELLRGMGLAPDARAQALSPEQFVALALALR